MKYILAVVATLLCIASCAQINGSSGHDITAVEFGKTDFRPKALNSYLFPTEKGFTNLVTYGIGWIAPGGTARAHSYDCAFGLHLYQPQKIATANDSLAYEARGWELMTSIFGYDVLRHVNAIDLTIGPGVYWGNLKLRKYFAGGNPKQFELFKNPFIAPMVRADLRVNLGPVSIGGRYSYRYDITKSKWKKGNSETLPGYQFREQQYVVYIGWIFNWKEN